MLGGQHQSASFHCCIIRHESRKIANIATVNEETCAPNYVQNYCQNYFPNYFSNYVPKYGPNYFQSYFRACPNYLWYFGMLSMFKPTQRLAHSGPNLQAADWSLQSLRHPEPKMNKLSWDTFKKRHCVQQLNKCNIYIYVVAFGLWSAVCNLEADHSMVIYSIHRYLRRFGIRKSPSPAIKKTWIHQWAQRDLNFWPISIET